MELHRLPGRPLRPKKGACISSAGYHPPTFTFSSLTSPALERRAGKSAVPGDFFQQVSGVFNTCGIGAMQVLFLQSLLKKATGRKALATGSKEPSAGCTEGPDVLY
jgi:hypothetical protein